MQVVKGDEECRNDSPRVLYVLIVLRVVFEIHHLVHFLPVVVAQCVLLLVPAHELLQLEILELRRHEALVTQSFVLERTKSADTYTRRIIGTMSAAYLLEISSLGGCRHIAASRDCSFSSDSSFYDRQFYAI